MQRAREAIDRSFEELAARSEQRAAEAPGRLSPGPPAQPFPHTTNDALESRVAEAADAIERRVGEMVSARLRSAERRLELQTQALEAALGEEAVQARLAAEQIEQVRDSLGATAAAALREVETAIGRMRERAAEDLNQRESASLAQAEARGAELEAQISQRDRESGERIGSRLDEIAAKLAADQEQILGRELHAARSELERSNAEHSKRFDRDAAARTEAFERRLAEHETVLIAGADERITAGLGEAKRALEMRIEGALAEVERRIREDVARDAEAEVVERTTGEISARLSAEAGRRLEESERRLGGLAAAGLAEARRSLEELAGTTAARRADDAVAEVEEAVKEAFEQDVKRLRVELDQLREELSVQSIKRERQLLEESGAEQLAKVEAMLEARGTLDRRLEERNLRSAEAAERRLSDAVQAGEARIAAADHAQDREENIRRRTEVARAEAEGRVRAAEQRLVEVLAQLERVDCAAPRTSPLEG